MPPTDTTRTSPFPSPSPLLSLNHGRVGEPQNQMAQHRKKCSPTLQVNTLEYLLLSFFACAAIYLWSDLPDRSRSFIQEPKSFSASHTRRRRGTCLWRGLTFTWITLAPAMMLCGRDCLPSMMKNSQVSAKVCSYSESHNSISIDLIPSTAALRFNFDFPI